jgi:hypothetical protein
VKICGICDKPIRADEEYDEIDKMSASGAGTTLYRHTRPCRPVLTQTSPSRGWR